MTGSIGKHLCMAFAIYTKVTKQHIPTSTLYIAKATLEKKRVFVQEMYDRIVSLANKSYLQHFRNHFSTIGA
jgi:ribonucleoside-triphosphate reductase